MKTGDLMAALRKLPGGKPFHVKLGKETFDEGLLEVSDDEVCLVMKAKAPAKPVSKGKKK